MMVAPLAFAAGIITASIVSEIIRPALSEVFAGVLPVEELGIRGTAISEFVQGTIDEAELKNSLRKSNLNPGLQAMLLNAAIKERYAKLTPKPIDYSQMPETFIKEGESREDAFKRFQTEQENITATGLPSGDVGDITGQPLEDYARMSREKLGPGAQAAFEKVTAERTAGGRKAAMKAQQEAAATAEAEKIKKAKMDEQTAMAQATLKPGIVNPVTGVPVTQTTATGKTAEEMAEELRKKRLAELARKTKPGV